MDKSYKSSQMRKKRIAEEHISATQWTTWEGLNHVLIGFVDELISLGARPQLKRVTLELWAKYLSKCEIAFLSKTKEAIPKFGLHQTAKDHAIIRNYLQKNKSSLRRLQKAKASLEAREARLSRIEKLAPGLCLDMDLDTSTKLLSLNNKKNQKKKRKRLLKNMEFRIKQIDSSYTQTRPSTANDELLDKHIKFTKVTQTAYLKLLEAANNPKATNGSLERKNPNENNKMVKMKLQLCSDPTIVTKKRVLAILCMGLFLTKGDIQISDVLRWILECRVSYFNIAGLLPKEYKLLTSDSVFTKGLVKMRYKSLERTVFHISQLMGVTVFPAPDMSALARRFVHELQLPTELGDRVERLMAACRVHRCEAMMSYEAVALSLLVVVLKTLFGLDGVTEHSLSKFAKEINGLMDNAEESRSEPRLFVWDDWVRYIECRKATISTKHFPTKYRTDKDLPTDAGPYALFTNRVLKRFQHLDGNKLYSLVMGSRKTKRTRSLRNGVANLPTWKKIKKAHEFPPSLTPDVSSLKEILARHTVPNKDVLTYDHTSTSMDFIIQPNKVKEFAHSQGVDIVVKQCPAYQQEYLQYVPVGVFQILRSASTKTCTIDFKDEGFYKSDQLPLDSHKRQIGKLRSCYNYNDYDQLVKKKLKKRKAKRVSTSCLSNSYTTSSTETNPLTLHLPCSYWVYDMKWSQTEIHFEGLVETEFSESFRWLLKECCRLLRMEAIDMYRIFRQVEKLCAGEITPAELKLKYRGRTWCNYI